MRYTTSYELDFDGPFYLHGEAIFEVSSDMQDEPVSFNPSTGGIRYSAPYAVYDATLVQVGEDEETAMKRPDLVKHFGKDAISKAERYVEGLLADGVLAAE